VSGKTVEDLAAFIYVYGDSLHDPKVRELLKTEFKSKHSPSKPEPEPEPDEEPVVEEPEAIDERLW